MPPITPPTTGNPGYARHQQHVTRAARRPPRSNANPYDAAHQQPPSSSHSLLSSSPAAVSRLRHTRTQRSVSWLPQLESSSHAPSEAETEPEADEEDDDGEDHEDADLDQSLEEVTGDVDDEVGLEEVASASSYDDDGSSLETLSADESAQHASEVTLESPSRQMDIDPELEAPFDTTGLKEIGNLASWTVTSFKPGCGVDALRDEDTNLYWQSDGPQPHSLSIHFSRLVSILHIRIYLDFEADESYTPTKISLLAGTGYHDLIPFRSLELAQPKGWTDVPLDGVGGRDVTQRRDDSIMDEDGVGGGGGGGGGGGDVLRAFLVQIRIIENHQNGKDTHVRGVKVYGRDERAAMVRLSSTVPGFGNDPTDGSWNTNHSPTRGDGRRDETAGRLLEPDWMGDPELR